MQRQAVPLLRARSPYVGTGMEYITARDSGAVVVARRSGTVDYVIIANAGGSKYKVGDIVEASDVGVDLKDVDKNTGRRRRGLEYEPHSYYLSAWEEDQYIIAQANAQVDEKGHLVQERINARQAGNFILSPREQVQFIDVSPKQLVSVAASLVPDRKSVV